jgi:hypothetical protein
MSKSRRTGSKARKPNARVSARAERPTDVVSSGPPARLRKCGPNLWFVVRVYR